MLNTYEPRHEKTCFTPHANNEGADQPAHPRSSIIPEVAVYNISRLKLASVAA